MLLAFPMLLAACNPSQAEENGQDNIDQSNYPQEQATELPESEPKKDKSWYKDLKTWACEKLEEEEKAEEKEEDSNQDQQQQPESSENQQ